MIRKASKKQQFRFIAAMDGMGLTKVPWQKIGKAKGKGMFPNLGKGIIICTKMKKTEKE